ncbi:MAG TPA: S8 family serine peptidase [Solirubrobacterales bacterium]
MPPKARGQRSDAATKRPRVAAKPPRVATKRAREIVKRAREAAKQSLGGALAEKASDEFCLALAAAPPPLPQGLARAAAYSGVEGFGGVEGLGAAVAPETTAVIELQDPVEEAGVEAAAPEADPGRAKAVKQALEALGEHAGWAEAALAAAAREAAIRAERDRFYDQFGAIRDEVERGAATLATGSAAPPRIGIAAAPVQACWLNSTIRAEAHASVLGEVAEHGAVERIDLPHRLEAEGGDVTIDDAAAFRAKAGLSGTGVLVAVIDTEVQRDHPALAGRVVHRRNYTQEPWGTPSPHGTAVAGEFAAAAEGFTGVAPGVQIYNYKILALQKALNGTNFEGWLAIQHALEDGVRVANCSWKSPAKPDGKSREVKACDKAWRRGMVIVKSVGNAGPGPGTLTAPADAEGVLTVGATNAGGTKIASYSSHGPTFDGRHRPHVVAPGGERGAGIGGIAAGGFIGTLPEPGTSFAAPQVAGMAALLIEREPALTPDQVRDRIVATCKKLRGAKVDEQGAGLVTPSAL